MTYKYDFLVIGSGIAGMSFALKVAQKGRVALVCKTTIDEANTALAQGGVASVTNIEVDDFDKHIHDTMVAGDWLSDPAAVEKVVKGAPEQIRQLIQWGVDFDKKENGDLTCTVRAATASSVFCTMPTIPVSKFRRALSRQFARIRKLMCSRIILPSKS